MQEGRSPLLDSLFKLVMHRSEGAMIRPAGLLLIMLLDIGFGCAQDQSKNSTLIPFQSGDLWGYKNSRGEVVIRPQFSIAQDFSAGGIAAVVDRSGWIYIDETGKRLLKPVVVDNGPDYFSEGLARFLKDSKIGFFNTQGKIVIEPRFDFAHPFSEGLSAFCEGCREERDGEHKMMVGGQWGFLDTSGRIVIKPIYEAVESFSEGRSRVMLQGRWINIDRRGLEQR
jgi:hypothetical protein